MNTGENDYAIILINGELHPAEKMPSAPDGTPVIYEVIRVMGGAPLFLEAHIERLNRSLTLAGFSETLNSQAIMGALHTLIAASDVKDRNLRLEAWQNPERICWTGTFVESHYPGAEIYSQGIDTGLLYMERSNPNAKVWQAELKAAVSFQCEQRQLYEMILVDAGGHISEGSRSNLFFTQGETLITAPDEVVLEGITRLKLLEIIAQQHIPLVKREIAVSELESFDGAFITGTSIHLLPVKRIDSWERHSSEQPLIRRLMDLFGKSIRQYQSDPAHKNHPQEDLKWNE